MTKSKSLTVVVRESAKRLDVEVKGWARHVSITKLNMNESKFCIVGQLHAAGKGLRLSMLNVDRGFCIEYTREEYFDGRSRRKYGELTRLWKEEIRKRRKGRTGPKF